jgi:O-antigen/teichoic acid export membrane protein
MAADKRLFGRFFRDAGLSFVSLAVSSLVYFVLRIFLAHYLDEGDLGLYTLAYTAYQFGVLLSAFGIGGALVKYVAESGEDTSRRGRLLFIGVLISFLIGCIMWLVLHFSSPWIAHRFFRMPELSRLMQIVAVSFPFIAMEKATLGFMNGVRRMTLYTFVNVFQSLLTIVLTVVLVHLGYGVEGAVVAMVIPMILMGLFSLFAVRRYLARPTEGQSLPILRILLRFGVFVVLGNGVYMLFYRIDSILIGHYLDDVTVGIYAIAGTLSGLVPLIPNAIQIVTQATIPRYWGRGESHSIQNLMNRAMKYTAMLIVPISFVGIVLSRDLITIIFGEEYVSATVPLQILLASFAFGGIFTAVGTALSSTNWIHVSFIIGAVQVAANTVLCVMLIPHLGMNGASAATAASHIAGNLVTLYVVQRLLKIAIDWKWFARFVATSAIVCGGSLALGLVVNRYLCMVLGLAILVPIIVRYFLSEEDRNMIKRMIPLRSRSS